MDIITASAMYPYISIFLNEAERREAEDVSFDMEARARGYVPERTCRVEYAKHGPLFDVLRFSCCGYEWAENRTDPGATEPDPNYCPNCGAKVVEE